MFRFHWCGLQGQTVRALRGRMQVQRYSVPKTSEWPFNCMVCCRCLRCADVWVLRDDRRAFLPRVQLSAVTPKHKAWNQRAGYRLGRAAAFQTRAGHTCPARIWGYLRDLALVSVAIDNMLSPGGTSDFLAACARGIASAASA